MDVNDEIFRAEVKKQLFIKKWKYKDLATSIGCAESYIKAFMCGSRNGSDLAEKISTVLGVKLP